jgi:glycerol uptake facilitator protein
MSRIPNWFWGEVLGTFILVFFGCGAVAGAVLMDWGLGGYQVAAIWGGGLSLAIFLTGGMSGAHLNPAITLAFTFYRGFPIARIPGYLAAQFLGAFLAAAVLFALFSSAITSYESSASIQRGQVGSEATAMVFGEYFPNPSGAPLTDEERAEVGHGRAFFLEVLGTALLAMIVFGFSAARADCFVGKITPAGIGLGLAALIAIFGPLTMACFNPARDLSPRFFSALAGWGWYPFQVNGIGWFTVYVFAPCIGAVIGGGLAHGVQVACRKKIEARAKQVSGTISRDRRLDAD